VSLTDRIIEVITDDQSIPNRVARWIIVLIVIAFALMVAAKYIGGLW
jgi:hypothetical protein